MKYIILILFLIFTNTLNGADIKDGRYFEDQPDVNNDYQIHFIYMLDKNGKDNSKRTIKSR